MSLALLIGSLVVLALLLAAIALRLLFRLPVLKHFMLGCMALFAVALSGTILLMAWDLYSYRTLLKETPVATVSFTRQNPQQFRASVTIDGKTHDYELSGDQWQMDVRMIKWNSTIARLGVAPIFRLDRLSGRYQRIDDERDKPRSVYPLSESNAIDLWDWLRKSESLIKLADTQYGTATYLPMVDGAVYLVTISQFGLVARPENQQARDAIARWPS